MHLLFTFLKILFENFEITKDFAELVKLVYCYNLIMVILINYEWKKKYQNLREYFDLKNLFNM